MSKDSPQLRSQTLIKGASRAGARAMLRASGLKDEDFSKPLIGVANTWIEIGPCNYHLRELAQHVKDGIRKAGGTPLEFNTVSISDGITMGTAGMKTSLISREVIVRLIGATTTDKGLDVQCCLDENEYPKAIKVSDAEMAAINLACDDFHGEWNYTISPQPRVQDDR